MCYIGWGKHQMEQCEWQGPQCQSKVLNHQVLTSITFPCKTSSAAPQSYHLPYQASWSTPSKNILESQVLNHQLLSSQLCPKLHWQPTMPYLEDVSSNHITSRHVFKDHQLLSQQSPKVLCLDWVQVWWAKLAPTLIPILLRFMMFPTMRRSNASNTQHLLANNSISL